MKDSRDRLPLTLTSKTTGPEGNKASVNPLEDFVNSVHTDRLTSWVESDGLDWVYIDELTFEDVADL